MDAQTGTNSRQDAQTRPDFDRVESLALEALGAGPISGKVRGARDGCHAGDPSERQTVTVDEDGRPYFAIEHVDGQPIDEYCDNRRLDIPARLELFTRVCRAAHFAHQHAVIHGDLKPRNILVTAEGILRLVGFGLAKSIHSDHDVNDDRDAPTFVSQTCELELTPEYTSPEQVKGEPITTASDVYALGVVLYELLSGRQPYRLKTRSTSEVLQGICEQVPEKPSMSVVHRVAKQTVPPSGSPVATGTFASASSSDAAQLSTSLSPLPTDEEIAAARGSLPQRLKRILDGDLDMITLMALRKEPDRRYASAEQFADDLERYLDGLPVRAHPDSPAYRAGKFARRHTVAVTVGLLLMLALVGSVVGTTVGLVVSRRERGRALESSRQARRAVDRFFARVSEERLLSQPTLQPLRKSLLQDARRFYEEFIRQRGSDPLLRAELAAAHAHAAKITGEIDSPAKAAAEFEQAVALWENLVNAQPDNLKCRDELARTLNDLGVMLLRIEGRRDEALHTFRRAQNLIEPLTMDDRSPAPPRHVLGMVLQNIAQIQFKQGQPNEAIATLQQVLAIEVQLASENPQSLDPMIAMAESHDLLGQILIGMPDGAETALEHDQKAVELLEAVIRQHPELPDQTYLLATYLGNLNVVQQMAGKLNSALRSNLKAIEILEQLDRQYAGVLNYQGGLASTYNMISELHRRRREPTESHAFAQKARAMLERLVSEHPDDAYARIDLARAHNNMGRVLQQTGEPVEALQSFQRAVDLYESVPKLDPRNTYNLACNVALCIPLIGIKNGSQISIAASKLTKGDQIRRQRYGDRAVEVFRLLTGGGFLNPEMLQSETDLDPLRDRPDFQALLKELEQKSAAAP